MCENIRPNKRNRQNSSDIEGNSIHVESMLGQEELVSKLFSDIAAIKEGQEALKCCLEKKLEDISQELRTEFNKVVDGKISMLKQEVNTSLHHMDNRISVLEDQLCSIHPLSPLKDHERCVIVQGIQYEDNEILHEKVQRLMNVLGPGIRDKVTVSGFERLKSRNTKYPPLLKIAFGDSSQKIEVLRSKAFMANSHEFSKARMHSSQSHTDRLIELNFKQIINSSPDLKGQFRIAANGRMLKRDKTQEVEQAVRLNRAASSNNQMSSNIPESQTAGRTALPGTSSEGYTYDSSQFPPLQKPQPLSVPSQQNLMQPRMVMPPGGQQYNQRPIHPSQLQSPPQMVSTLSHGPRQSIHPLRGSVQQRQLPAPSVMTSPQGQQYDNDFTQFSNLTQKR